MGLCVPYLIVCEKVCAVSWKVRWLQKSITVRTCLVAVSVLGWNFRVRHFMYVLKPASGSAVFIEKLKVAQTLAVLPTQVHCIGLQRSPMGPILRLLNTAQTFAASFKLKFNSTLLLILVFIPNNIFCVVFWLKVSMCFTSSPCVIKFHFCDQSRLNELIENLPYWVFKYCVCTNLPLLCPVVSMDTCQNYQVRFYYDAMKFNGHPLNLGIFKPTKFIPGCVILATDRVVK